MWSEVDYSKICGRRACRHPEASVPKKEAFSQTVYDTRTLLEADVSRGGQWPKMKDRLVQSSRYVDYSLPI